MTEKKLLIICGPTATGKTTLALHLARKFNGELISADSRQVYKNMDIGTGKDVPQDAIWHLANLSISNYQFSIGYWETENFVRIWGYDLANPDQEFSVAHYQKFAEKVLQDIWVRGNLPILVGGTGLYIKAVTDGIGTVDIPKNINLRQSISEKSADELFELLRGSDPIKAASLNMSDKRNRRRLIRAIEIASERSHKKVKREGLNIDKYFIGLKGETELLEKRIARRVKARIDMGFGKEVKSLIDKNISWDSQAMSVAGYKVWNEYLNEKITYEEALEKWITKEKQYAKRQMTWFKRDSRIMWFDIESEYKMSVEKMVKKWHNREIVLED